MGQSVILPVALSLSGLLLLYMIVYLVLTRRTVNRENKQLGQTAQAIVSLPGCQIGNLKPTVDKLADLKRPALAAILDQWIDDSNEIHAGSWVPDPLPRLTFARLISPPAQRVLLRGRRFLPGIVAFAISAMLVVLATVVDTGSLAEITTRMLVLLPTLLAVLYLPFASWLRYQQEHQLKATWQELLLQIQRKVPVYNQAAETAAVLTHYKKHDAQMAQSTQLLTEQIKALTDQQMVAAIAYTIEQVMLRHVVPQIQRSNEALGQLAGKLDQKVNDSRTALQHQFQEMERQQQEQYARWEQWFDQFAQTATLQQTQAYQSLTADSQATWQQLQGQMTEILRQLSEQAQRQGATQQEIEAAIRQDLQQIQANLQTNQQTALTAVTTAGLAAMEQLRAQNATALQDFAASQQQIIARQGDALQQLAGQQTAAFNQRTEQHSALFNQQTEQQNALFNQLQTDLSTSQQLLLGQVQAAVAQQLTTARQAIEQQLAAAKQTAEQQAAALQLINDQQLTTLKQMADQQTTTLKQVSDRQQQSQEQLLSQFTGHQNQLIQQVSDAQNAALNRISETQSTALTQFGAGQAQSLAQLGETQGAALSRLSTVQTAAIATIQTQADTSVQRMLATFTSEVSGAVTTGLEPATTHLNEAVQVLQSAYSQTAVIAAGLAAGQAQNQQLSATMQEQLGAMHDARTALLDDLAALERSSHQISEATAGMSTVFNSSQAGVTENLARISVAMAGLDDALKTLLTDFGTQSQLLHEQTQATNEINRTHLDNMRSQIDVLSNELATRIETLMLGYGNMTRDLVDNVGSTIRDQNNTLGYTLKSLTETMSEEARGMSLYAQQIQSDIEALETNMGTAVGDFSIGIGRELNSALEQLDSQIADILNRLAITTVELTDAVEALPAALRDTVGTTSGSAN